MTISEIKQDFSCRFAALPIELLSDSVFFAFIGGKHICRLRF